MQNDGDVFVASIKSCGDALRAYRIHRQQLVRAYEELNARNEGWAPRCKRNASESELVVRGGGVASKDGKFSGVGIVTDTNPYGEFHDFQLLDATGAPPEEDSPAHTLQVRIAYLMEEIRKAGRTLFHLLPQVTTLSPTYGIDPTPLTELRARLAPFPFLPVRSRTIDLKTTSGASFTIKTDEAEDFSLEKRREALKADEPFFDRAHIALEHLLQARWRASNTPSNVGEGSPVEPAPAPPSAAEHPSSWEMLTQATKFYPPAKYAIGLLAVGIVVVLIFQLARGLNIAIAAAGIPAAIVLIVAMIYLSKFAQTAEGGRSKVVRVCSHMFAIFCLTMICAFLLMLFTSAAFGVPEHLTRLLFPRE